MEREQLEQHRDTLRGAMTTLGQAQQSGPPPSIGTIVDAIYEVGAVVEALINERIVAGEHAHAVSEMIKRPDNVTRTTTHVPPEPRMTLDEARQGSKVEPGGKISEEQANEQRERERLQTIAREPDPRD